MLETTYQTAGEFSAILTNMDKRNHKQKWAAMKETSLLLSQSQPKTFPVVI